MTGLQSLIMFTHNVSSVIVCQKGCLLYINPSRNRIICFLCVGRHIRSLMFCYFISAGDNLQTWMTDVVAAMQARAAAGRQ